jgi:hypothetical protein
MTTTNPLTDKRWEAKMKDEKRKRLEAAGWKFGSAQEFLGYSNDESVFIEMKLALANSVRNHRLRAHLSQADLASRLQSRQSRVAKIEAADPSVSVDLLVRAVLATGAHKDEVAKAILGGYKKRRVTPGRGRRTRSSRRAVA